MDVDVPIDVSAYVPIDIVSAGAVDAVHVPPMRGAAALHFAMHAAATVHPPPPRPPADPNEHHRPVAGPGA